MISTKQVGEKLFQVTDSHDNFLQYRQDSEYINASALCLLIKGKRTNMLGLWLRSRDATRLIKDLDWDLCDANDIRPYYIDSTIDHNTFVHPSLVFNLTMFLDYKFNFAICNLMKQIMLNCAAPPKVYHTFTFFELRNPKLGPMKQYKAVEGMEASHKRGCECVIANHPEAMVLFQCKVPDNVYVIREIKHDFATNGNICINRDLYCGSKLDMNSLMNLLRKFCKIELQPCNTYDVVDYSDANSV
jgi:KilA-N domain